MEIYNIDELDEYEKSILKEAIPEALLKSAIKVKDKAKSLFTQKLPMATHRNPKYNDTLVDAIYAGKVNDDRIKITAAGNRKSGSGTYRTAFFMGGTKQRESAGYRRTKTGIKYIGQENRGRITMKANSVSYALRSLSGEINNIFKESIKTDSIMKREEKENKIKAHRSYLDYIGRKRDFRKK